MNSNREPVMIVAAILAALQTLVGGAALADAIGKDAAGLASLVVAALTVGLSTWTRSQVTPVDARTGSSALPREDTGTSGTTPAL